MLQIAFLGPAHQLDQNECEGFSLSQVHSWSPMVHETLGKLELEAQGRLLMTKVIRSILPLGVMSPSFLYPVRCKPSLQEPTLSLSSARMVGATGVGRGSK